jgi:integration host factor subunit alpha
MLRPFRRVTERIAFVANRLIITGEKGRRIVKKGGRMRSMETLTRAEIADSINRKLGLSRTESLAMVESVLTLMSDALARGENLKISGFGTFLLRDKSERIGRNPKTGVEVPITPRRVLTFRASQMLKDHIAGK